MRLNTIISELFKRGKSLQEFIYPHSCLECGVHLDGFSGLCASCAQKFILIKNNHCKDCGTPFELSVGNDISCATCFQEKPPYDYARSIFIYEKHIKNLILKLKYGDAHYMVPFFAQQMVHYMRTHNIVADYVIPVPSHYYRLFIRKYNPVAILVDAISKQSKIPSLMDGLKRVKYKTQKGYNKTQRQQHLHKAFICSPKMHSIIKQKDILLIDDVMTTGSTIKECSKILLKAGAKSVIVLTVARATLMYTHQTNLDIDF